MLTYVLIAAGAALLLAGRGLTSAPSATAQGFTPPTVWPPTVGQPGYVTIGGQPAPASYSLGNIQTAITASGLATSATGGILGVGSAIGATAPGGALAAGTAAATAIPLVGIAAAAIGLVVGIIGKHHAQAVAAEANSLNQAVPAIVQRCTLIIQSVIHGDVTTEDQLNTLCQQALSDYYAMVKSTIQGKWDWPYIRGKYQALAYTGGGSLQPETKKPGTCNGPCVVGHYWIEPAIAQAYIVGLKVMHGEHGTAKIVPTIAAHAGFSGMPEVDIQY